jgi:hypothetical protein
MHNPNLYDHLPRIQCGIRPTLIERLRSWFADPTRLSRRDIALLTEPEAER